ncbi:MAG: biotin/lipoyl-binding protein [Vicingaceae bacterium]|nr:biotin/lipoyl-binding protein [Vicingaceae bacterium]
MKVISENKREFNVEFDKNALSGTIDGTPFNWDIKKIKNNLFHVIKDNKSYNLELLKLNPEEKTVFVKINGLKYKFQLKDKFDDLLHSLGMDNLLVTKVSDLKAPMPGLVLSIDVEIGKEVKKGDALLILEAMKMENVIKSPTDGVIKSIAVKTSQAVEKNQLLLHFE